MMGRERTEKRRNGCLDVISVVRAREMASESDVPER